jgi:hypothetical protein
MPEGSFSRRSRKGNYYPSPIPLISDGGQGVSYKHGKMKLNKEDLGFCTNFILESALKLQEFELELKTQ